MSLATACIPFWIKNYEEALTIGNSEHEFQKVEIRSSDWYRALHLTCASQNVSWKKVQTNSVSPNCVKCKITIIYVCIII